MKIIEREIDKPVYEQVLKGSEKVKITVCIAEDGKEFIGLYSKEECRRYDAQLEKEKQLKELLKDVVQKKWNYEDDFYDWYYFKDQDTLINYMKFIGYTSSWWFEWAKNLSYPQWVGIQSHDGGDSADYYVYTCLDYIKTSVKDLEKALSE